MQKIILKDGTALITGASGGRGKAMATSLGESGVRVALVARDVHALNETVAELVALGCRAKAFPADVSDEEQVEKLERDVRDWAGPVSILINNVGANLRKRVEDFTLKEWNDIVRTNLTTIFLMCRAFIPGMKAYGAGRIINMASTMAHISLPPRTVYSATKSAVLGFTRSLALELAQDSISVVSISPGPFETEMNAPMLQDPALYASFTSRIPLGRWGQVKEIGALARFLCSDEATFITGTDILIDGGWCSQ